MTSLTSWWAEAGHDVTLITLADESDDVYQTHSRVRRIALALMKESRSLGDGVVLNLRRARAIRRLLGELRPDVFVSFHVQLNVLALLACLRLRIPIVVSERVHPPAHRIGRPWRFLRRATYRLADVLVVQSEEARRWARRLVHADRIRVIPNAVSEPFRAPANAADSRGPMVLGVGRLVPQKGFDLLIRAFGAIAGRHPGWSLAIIGEGPEEQELRTLAQGLGLESRIQFAGRVTEPERYYRAAGLFVLSSRFEGFPNALLEAMACGCASISTDCKTGPSEIIRDGIDGLLVPSEDVAPLASAMERLIGNAALRREMGVRAREVTTRFGRERVMGMWDDAIAAARG